MWNGKNKAITFSFDDGVLQDIRLAELFNKYNLKATFNINSALLGTHNSLKWGEKTVAHDKVFPSKVKEVYAGHEVAAHTLTHAWLPSLADDAVIYQVERDRLTLSDLLGYEVVGMAYPGGGENNNDHIAELVKNHTGIKYARTIVSTGNFDLQDNYYRFNPTVYACSKDFESIVDKFIELKTDKPQLLYIWGHAYEMDTEAIPWDRFERIIAKLANLPDVFYGTNKEVLL